MHADGALPAQFSHLEPFIADWALPTQQERNDKRVASTMEQLDSFYAIMIQSVDAIAAYIDRFPIDAMPPSAVHLMLLGMSLMEIAPAVEIMRTPDVDSTYARERLVIRPQEDQYRVAIVDQPARG